MNRIFHARIALGQYLFLFLVAGMTVWAITSDGNLVLYYGRFIQGKSIPLHEVTNVEQVYGIRLFGVGLMRCVLVHHGNKTEALMPVKEEEFIDVINKKRMK